MAIYRKTTNTSQSIIPTHNTIRRINNIAFINATLYKYGNVTLASIRLLENMTIYNVTTNAFVSDEYNLVCIAYFKEI